MCEVNWSATLLQRLHDSTSWCKLLQYYQHAVLYPLITYKSNWVIVCSQLMVYRSITRMLMHYRISQSPSANTFWYDGSATIVVHNDIITYTDVSENNCHIQHDFSFISISLYHIMSCHFVFHESSIIICIWCYVLYHNNILEHVVLRCTVFYLLQNRTPHSKMTMIDKRNPIEHTSVV